MHILIAESHRTTVEGGVKYIHGYRALANTRHVGSPTHSEGN